ncbi:hypothetical protein AAY473_003021 [Plecturocebus cupreus]
MCSKGSTPIRSPRLEGSLSRYTSSMAFMKTPGDKSQGLTLSSRLECSGVIMAHCSLHFPGSETGSCHVVQAALKLLAQVILPPRLPKMLGLRSPHETGFHHVGQAGLQLLTSGDPPTLASQSAGITGVRYCTLPLIPPSFLRNYFGHSLLWFDAERWMAGIQTPGPPTHPLLSQGWSAGAPSRFPAASTSWAPLIVSPLPPESLGLSAHTITPGSLLWSLTLLPGWGAVGRSQLTATSSSRVQAILLPQTHE